MRFSICCNPKVVPICTPSCPNLELFFGETRTEVDGGEGSEIGIGRKEGRERIGSGRSEEGFGGDRRSHGYCYCYWEIENDDLTMK